MPYEKTGQYIAGTTFAEGLVYFHDQWLLYYGCADSLVGVVTAPKAAFAGVPGFYLKNNDTVVFYGDSITEQNLYNQWVELYTVTRFPSMRVHFYGAGVGGDRVTGGGGGPIDERLRARCLSSQANGRHRDAGNERRQLPADDRRDSIDLHKRLSSICSIRFANTRRTRASRCSAPRRSTMSAGRPVRRRLQRRDAAFRRSRQRPGAEVWRNIYRSECARNCCPSKSAATRSDGGEAAAARSRSSRSARALGDGRGAVEGMACAGAGSSVNIDGRAASVTEAQNAAVDQLRTENGVLHWTETDNGLPLPILQDNATQALLLQISDIQQQLNQEPLRVTGLAHRQLQAADRRHGHRHVFSRLT